MFILLSYFDWIMFPFVLENIADTLGFFVEKIAIKLKERQCLNSLRRKDKREESGNNLAYLYLARVFRHAVDQPRDYVTSLFCSFDRPSCFLNISTPGTFLKPSHIARDGI